MLLALTSIIAHSLAARGLQLQSRAIQSQAVCSSDFSWAENSLSQSPCQVAAMVDAACNQGNWIIPALNSSSVYTPPSGSTATPCTCSWASYNLISACTDCQGFTNVTTSWAVYSDSCAGLLSNTYFPTNITLLSDTLIPFWATTNPTTWTGAQFNSAAAESINNEGHPDIGNTPTAPPKSKPIGAIVGGVVGGVVILLAAIIFAICLIRRTSRLNKPTEPSPLLMANHTHLRSQSDVTNPNSMSTPNMSMPTGYTALSSSPMRLSSPTIRTHASSSIRSFPFFSTGGSTVAPSLRPMSPPPISMHRDASEAVVEPFRLTPTSNHNPDRKQADGAYPVYDSPNAPPTVRMTVRGSTTTTTQGGRTRFNPPAYTEQTKGSPETGASSRPSPAALGQLHGKKGSADTLQSVTSGGSAPRVGGSNPARGNVVYSMAPSKNPQMNSHVASASSSANAITGHRRQQSGDTNSDTGRKGRADTDENFSARDIA